jgi:hypothetical protein
MSRRTASTAREVTVGKNRWPLRVIAVLTMVWTTEAVPEEIKLHPAALDLRHRELGAQPTANPTPCCRPADCVMVGLGLAEIPARLLVGGPPTSPVVRMARGFKQEGLPLAVLWQSPRNRIAIGINRHGTPGLRYTRRQN